MARVTSWGVAQTYEVTVIEDGRSEPEVLWYVAEDWPDEPEYAADAIRDEHELRGDEVIEIRWHATERSLGKVLYENPRY